MARAAALAFAVVVVFSPILSNDWLSWDDREALVENDALNEPGILSWAFRTDHMSHFQPLSWLVWSTAARTGGESPAVFHALSLAFHALNAVLLYLLMLKLSLGRNAALIAASFYAIHPLRVEPVAWASAFPYLLSTSFLLVATLLYLSRSLAGSALAYAASILARPIALAYPLVLLALDLYPSKRERGPRPLLEKLPFVVISLIGLAAEGRSRRFLDVDAFGVGARLTLAADSLLAGLTRLVWPVGLTPLDPLPLEPRLDPPLVALGFLCLAGTGVIVFHLRARFPAAPVLWLSWLLLLLPSLGLTPSGLQATADRYSYVPGLVIAVALGAALARARASVLWASLALIVLLAGATFRQCLWWQDSVALWGRAVALDPTNDLALYFHASALAEAGRRDEAEMRYRELLRILPEHAPARKDLALLEAREADALAARGDLAPAVELYESALEWDPGIPELRERRAMALFELGMWEKALPALRDAFEGGPSSPEVAGAFALALLREAQSDEAASVLAKALERFPDDLPLSHNLARLLATGDFPGREDEAVLLAERVVEETEGSDPRALDTLALALASRGSRGEARSAFARAIELARSRGEADLAREIEAHARAVAR